MYDIAPATMGSAEVGRLSGVSWSSASVTRCARVRKKSSDMASPCGRSIGHRTAYRTISRTSGVTARMRARVPAFGTSRGSNMTDTVRTDGFMVAECSSPAGIHAACCGGRRYLASAVSTSTTPPVAYSI